MEDRKWTEAREQQFPAIRWNEVTDAETAEKTVYLGEVVEGRYVEKKEGLGSNNSTMYVLEVESIGKVGVWGSQVLDARMSQVALNHDVRITFLGEQKSKVGGRKPWKNFRVESAKPVMVEKKPAASGSPATTATAPTAAPAGATVGDDY